MVKTLDQRKFHRKNKRIRRLSHRIKFIKKSTIRKPSSDSTTLDSLSEIKKLQKEAKNIMNLSLNNAVYSFVTKITGKNDEELTQNMLKIIKVLSININIFSIWTMFVEHYSKQYEFNRDYETMFYIGLVAKEKFNPDFVEKLKGKINQEKLEKMKSIFHPLNIGLKEMNQRIKNSKNSFIMQKSIINYEKMVEFICKVKNEKEQAKRQKKDEKNTKEENEENNHEINNINQKKTETNENMIIKEFENHEEEEEKDVDDDVADPNTPFIGLYDYENENLPGGEDIIYEKLDDSFHNINYRQTFKDLGYIH